MNFDGEGTTTITVEYPPYAGVICASCGLRYDQHAPYGGSIKGISSEGLVYVFCPNFVFPAGAETCFVCGFPFSRHSNGGPCQVMEGEEAHGCNEYTPPPQTWERVTPSAFPA